LVTARRVTCIAALWNEEDPPTGAKLHVAFALACPSEFADERTGALTHLQKQIADLRRSLTAEQRKTLDEFVRWCEDAAGQVDVQTDPVNAKSVLQKIRSALASDR
jgi:hypothetical protein